MLTLNQKISILQNDLSGLSQFSKEISGGILEDSISSILFLNEKISYSDLSLGHIIEDDLGIRTSQLSIRPANDLQDAVQEIYSKNGTATLKLGDDNVGTLTFNNILKSENGNASFYGSGEKKYMEYNSTDDKIILLKDTDVNGDIICNGNFELGTITDLEQKIIDISNNSSSGGGGGTINEGDFSTQLDVSNQGTGPALKVSQFGVGDDQDVALFNAGLEGDALKIDSYGNSHFYKHVNVSGTMTSNSPWALLGQTIDGDSSEDQSGYSVSINAKGDIVAIGAPLDDNNVTSSGSTKMYQYTNGSWNQLGQTIDGDSGDDWSGRSVSINAKGDIVAIGARYDDNRGTSSGSTKMYQYTNGSWNQLGQTIDGDSSDDRSGHSVSINAKGDIVSIGAFLDDNNGSNSGSTKMYQYTNGSWNQLGQTIDGDSGDDFNGYSVSINAKGDIVAIGAPLDDKSGSNSGSTKMYQYTNGSWNQLGQTIDGDYRDDYSGYSVSINAKGDIVAIGARYDDNNVTNSGSTKIYQYTNGLWNQLGQTIDGDYRDDQSGYSVSINAKGDIVAIGAIFDDNNGNNSGSTKMYQYTNGSWNQFGQTINGDSSEDRSGTSVSINAKGDIVAIGAHMDDNSGSNSGSTKIYQKGLRGNVTIEDDLSVGGDLIVNGGIYTDNFSVADTTGHTTIGGDLQLGSIPNVEQKIIDLSNSTIPYITYDSVGDKLNVTKDTNVNGDTNITGNLQLGSITDVENAINNAGGVPSITYDAVTETTTFDGSFVVMPQLTITPADVMGDATQEIYSKSGITTLKLGDNDGTTTTFSNILKSENGNASFYGSGEKKYMEYNSTDDKIILLKDTDVNGDIICNGNFELGTITDLEQKIIDISNNSSSGGGDLLISDTSGLELALSTKQPTINEGDLLISDTSGLELTFSSKQDEITKQTNLNLGSLTLNDSIIAKYIKQIGGDIISTISPINRFGVRLSMNSSGNIIAVGAPYEKGESGENYAGSVTAFKYDDGSWNTLGQLIRGSGGGDRLSVCSLNSDGTILAVSSSSHDGGIGQVRVFQYNDVSWVQLGSDIDGPGGNFGYSLSINNSGYIIAVGAMRTDRDRGSTLIYEFNGTSWLQKGQTINGKYNGGRSGFSVSINSTGTIVAIGSYLSDGSGNNSGLTHIYEYDEITSSWEQLGNDINGENTDDWSGSPVYINSTGNIVAIGAPRNSDNGSLSGHVRVYKYDGTNTTWIKLGQDIDGDGVDDAASNVSINSTGNIIAVSSNKNDNNGNNSGHVRVFEYNENNDVWILEYEINGRVENDNFGFIVVINSEGNIVSAVSSTGTSNHNKVRVYELKSDNIITLNDTIDVSINNLTIDNNLHVNRDISCNGTFKLNTIADVEQKIIDLSNATIPYINYVGDKLVVTKDTNVNGDTNITGNLQLGSILDVENAINNAGGVPSSITYDAVTETTTFDGSFVVMPQLTITPDDVVMINTIVITGSAAIQLHELQLWVNGTNILPIYTNSPSNNISGQEIGNTIEFFDKTTNLTQESYGSNYKALFTADNNLQNLPHSKVPNPSLYIPMTTHININNIQSFVLYSRKANPNISLGLRIELYNREIDPSLSSPIVYTNSINISGTTYRFDFPAINTYTNGFVNTDSISQIVSDDYAITETTMATRTSQTTLDVNGEIDCTEIKVNSIPLNSFYNFTYGYNYTPTLPGIYFGWGCHIQLDTSTFNNAYSHFQTFRRDENDIHSFRCESNYLGTYEITAHVIYRNKQGLRHNPCIAIGVNDDVCDGAIGVDGTGPNWDVGLTTGYCQHNIFSTQYVRTVEGKVSNLSCSRIYHFTNTTDKISINTFIEGAAGDLFNEAAVSSVYQIINAGISFKYIGNFNNITYIP